MFNWVKLLHDNLIVYQLVKHPSIFQLGILGQNNNYLSYVAEEVIRER